MTLGLFFLILKHVEPGTLYEKLVNLSFSQVVFSLLLLICQSLIVSKRWQSILRAMSIEVSYTRVLLTHYRSLSSALILPNVVAEPGIKAYLLRDKDAPLSSLLLSVIVDKISVVVGLVIMSLVTVPILFYLLPGTRVWYWSYAVLLILLVVSVLVCFLQTPGAITRSISRRLGIENPGLNLQAVFKSIENRRIVLRVILLTIISQVVAICSLYILTLKMEPGLSFSYCLLLMPPVMLVTAIPVAFNGWGTRELAMIYILGFVNIASESALALSVQFGIIGILLWSIGLFFWIPMGRGNNEIK